MTNETYYLSWEEPLVLKCTRCDNKGYYYDGLSESYDECNLCDAHKTIIEDNNIVAP